MRPKKPFPNTALKPYMNNNQISVYITFGFYHLVYPTNEQPS
jgi:hypothetical protein